MLTNRRRKCTMLLVSASRHEWSSDKHPNREPYLSCTSLPLVTYVSSGFGDLSDLRMTVALGEFAGNTVSHIHDRSVQEGAS